MQHASKLLRENGLSVSLALLVVVALVGHALAGYGTYRQELAQHGAEAAGMLAYLGSGHFLESFFENCESEFLQMALFVLAAAKLRQKGSAESKSLDGEDEVDEDPRKHRDDPSAPWPVRRGGLVLRLYEHSLSLSLFALFAFSFAMHAVHGLRLTNQEQALHGAAPRSLGTYVT